MRTVGEAMFNSEADTIARIEALEIEARDIRRRLEASRSELDQAVLRHQISELRAEIVRLKDWIQPRPPKLTLRR